MESVRGIKNAKKSLISFSLSGFIRIDLHSVIIVDRVYFDKASIEDCEFCETGTNVYQLRFRDGEAHGWKGLKENSNIRKVVTMRTFDIRNVVNFFSLEMNEKYETFLHDVLHPIYIYLSPCSMLTFSCWLSSRFLSDCNLLTNLLVFIIFCCCAAVQISINTWKGNTHSACGKSVMSAFAYHTIFN